MSNHQFNYDYITTTSEAVDEDFGGGIKFGNVYLIYGKDGAGKSRFCDIISYGALFGITQNAFDGNYSFKFASIVEHLEAIRRKTANYSLLTHVFYFVYDDRYAEMIERLENMGVDIAKYLVISGYLNIPEKFAVPESKNVEDDTEFIMQSLIQKFKQLPKESLIIIDSINLLLEGRTDLTVARKKYFVFKLKEIAHQRHQAIIMTLKIPDVEDEQKNEILKGFNTTQWIIEADKKHVRGTEMSNTLNIIKGMTDNKVIYWDVREGMLIKNVFMEVSSE